VIVVVVVVLVVVVVGVRYACLKVVAKMAWGLDSSDDGDGGRVIIESHEEGC